MVKYEHIAKFRNTKGERVKFVIKSDKAVIVFKSPLGAVYEKSIVRADVLTRKGYDELDAYFNAVVAVVESLHLTLAFDYHLSDLTNEIYYCGVK